MTPMSFDRQSKLVIVITRTQKFIKSSLHDVLTVIINDGSIHKSGQNGIQKKETIKSSEEQKYGGVATEGLVGSINHGEKWDQCFNNGGCGR